MSKYFCECSNEKYPNSEMCEECFKIEKLRYTTMVDGIRERKKNLSVKKKKVAEDYKVSKIWKK